MAEATLKDVREYFGMTMQEFSKEWRELPAEDKVHIKSGLTDGTLNY
jgi:hypothetical protein